MQLLPASSEPNVSSILPARNDSGLVGWQLVPHHIQGIVCSFFITSLYIICLLAFRELMNSHSLKEIFQRHFDYLHSIYYADYGQDSLTRL